jgi:hypothetical protein
VALREELTQVQNGREELTGRTGNG